MPECYTSVYSFLIILLSSILLTPGPSSAQSADSTATQGSDVSTAITVDSTADRMQPSPKITTTESEERDSLTIDDTEQTAPTVEIVPDTTRSSDDEDSASSSKTLYGGYAPMQRSGSRGITSGGGPATPEPRRRIIEDTTSVANESVTTVSTADTVALPSPDSTKTFSLHKMSTRSKIITGISATAIVGGVITFMLTKKLKDQVIEDPPLPDPPPPPDF